MEDLKQVLNESLDNSVNESRSGDFSLTDNVPASDIAVGAFNGQEIGVIIGGIFKGGNKAAQNKAEKVVSKMGLTITRTYDDYQADALHNDDDLTGVKMCYFYNQGLDSVECQVFGDDPECVVAVN